MGFNALTVKPQGVHKNPKICILCLSPHTQESSFVIYSVLKNVNIYTLHPAVQQKYGFIFQASLCHQGAVNT